jgi:hypothetical protein
LNCELVSKEDATDAVAWMQEKFNALWNEARE